MITKILHGEKEVSAFFYDGCPEEDILKFGIKNFKLDVKREYKLVKIEDYYRICKVKEK